jgi:HlyD family secretion protein
MDIQRPDISKAKRRKRVIYLAIAAGLLACVTIVLGRLKPAAPSVDRNILIIDLVKRGQLLRQVRGLGTLVPEEIRSIPARTQGRVDKILLRPGANVTPDSVIIQLTNPQVEQDAVAADSKAQAGAAELENLKSDLNGALLEREAAVVRAKSDYENSRLSLEVNEQLLHDGLVSALEAKRSKVNATQASANYEIEQQRRDFARDSRAPKLAVKAAEAERLRAEAKLRHADLDALMVRSDMTGVLQVLSVEVGALVQPGTPLARVANPARLKAEIKIAETQAKDIVAGQPAQIDTRNGVVEGKVARVDPSVQNGTRTVEVQLLGSLPRGAVPDLSVDGTIELERLDNVVFMSRPAFGQEGATVGVFKLEPDGIHAGRTPVKLGRSSVSVIEIVQGLLPGDRVITSDTTTWDGTERIKLN